MANNLAVDTMRMMALLLLLLRANLITRRLRVEIISVSSVYSLLLRPAIAAAAAADTDALATTIGQAYCCSTLCLKKTSPMFLAITRESIVGFS